jgi:hypothetical protein
MLQVADSEELKAESRPEGVYPSAQPIAESKPFY